MPSFALLSSKGDRISSFNFLRLKSAAFANGRMFPTYKATVALLLSPARQSISLMADAKALVRSRDDG